MRYAVERAQSNKPALSKMMHLMRVFQGLLAQDPQVKISVSDLQKAFVELHNVMSPGMPGMGYRTIIDNKITNEKIPVLTHEDADNSVDSSVNRSSLLKPSGRLSRMPTKRLGRRK
jgi:hypothetical protein